MMAEGLLSLAWNNHSSTFTHMLSMLRNKERYTDATITCDGKFYSVHKLVLSTCSDYFLKMFERTPCKHPIVVLRDVQCRDIEALLSYMYEGVVSVAQNDLAQLIKVAELLQIKGLAVPDEPPVKKRGPTAAQSPVEDRTSPQPKRQKKDHNNGQSHSDIRQVLPSIQASSPRQPVRQDSFHSKEPDRGGEERLGVDAGRAGEERLDGGGRGGEERLDGGGRGGDDRLGGRSGKELCNDDNKAGDRVDVPELPHREEKKERSDTLHKKHPADVQKSFPMTESEIIDENVIKEEVVESSSEGDRIEYGALGEVAGDSGGSVEDSGGLYLASMFNNIEGNASFNSQAGPSGLQGWPMTGDAESMTPQAYMNQEVSLPTQPGSIPGHPGALQGQPRSLQDQPHHLVLPLPEDLQTMVFRTQSSPPSYHCEFCSYSFLTPSLLKRHIRTHTGEKPFTCPHCTFRSARKCNLKTHMLIHDKEKTYAQNTYTCAYCSLSFGKRLAYLLHLQSHGEGEKTTQV